MALKSATSSLLRLIVRLKISNSAVAQFMFSHVKLRSDHLFYSLLMLPLLDIPLVLSLD